VRTCAPSYVQLRVVWDAHDAHEAGRRASPVDAVDAFFARQLQRCAETPHVASFTLSMWDHRHSPAAGHRGCDECRHVVGGAGAAAEGDPELWDALQSGCRKLLALPCCAVHKPSAAPVVPWLAQPHAFEPLSLNETLLASLLETDADADAVAASGGKPAASSAWVVNQKKPRYLRREGADEFEPTRQWPHAGHAHCDPRGPRATVQRGVAELHIHMFSHLGFGGMLYGKSVGPIAEALKPCNGKWDHGVGIEDFHSHSKRKNGFPDFIGGNRRGANPGDPYVRSRLNV
jgi:hypothetical protein